MCVYDDDDDVGDIEDTSADMFPNDEDGDEEEDYILGFGD